MEEATVEAAPAVLEGDMAVEEEVPEAVAAAAVVAVFHP
jgi:hypothetical protein